MKSAELLQLVWFTASQTPLKAAEVYRSFFGEDPDGSQINRNINPIDPVLSTANGLLDEVVAEVQIRPGRADLYLRPIETNPDGMSVSTMDLERAMRSLKDKSINIYKAAPATTRISLVSRLIENSESSESASQQVLSNVGVTISAPDLSDAVFQINSRISITDKIKINRIMRFESALVQNYAVDIRQATQGLLPIIREQNYVVLHLDINTAPLPTPLTEDEMLTSFNTIANELLKLSASADPKELEK